MRENIIIESKIDDVFKEIYHNLLQEGEKDLVSYFGKFSTDLVGSFTDRTEEVMKNDKASKIVVKRMFSVMVEGLQNICIHGKEVPFGKIYGHILLIKKKEGYRVSFGNFVDSQMKKKLTQIIKKVNNMSAQELKEYYLKILGKGAFTDKNGAGLGIITIALKFNTEVQFTFKPINNDLYYYNLIIEAQ